MSADRRQGGPVVVVTGASGFLGARVVAALRQRHANVVPVARRPGAGWTQIDDYAETPPGDVIVHLAEDSDRGRVNKAGEVYAAQVRRTIECLRAKSGHRLVYASSGLLYGDAAERPCRPGDPVQLTDNYARSKRAGELLTLEHTGGVALRISNLYGPGMSANNVVSTILAQVPGRDDLCVWDDAPVRDFLWIEDAAAAVAAVALGTGTGIYNLGRGQGNAVREVAEVVLALAGQGHRNVCSTRPAGRHSSLVLAIGGTTRGFGWEPTTSLKQGLERLMTSKLIQP